LERSWIAFYQSNTKGQFVSNHPTRAKLAGTALSFPCKYA
jgi:hypothetical protein